MSSIGDYFPTGSRERVTIGADERSWFETMVFRTDGAPEPDAEGCGCRTVISWDPLDGERYATAGAAQAGHERYVGKYLKIAQAEGS